jgi:hypothetical protein
MSGIRIEGNTTGNVAEVDVNNNLKTVIPPVTGGNAENASGIRVFSENDPGLITGTSFIESNECDEDYRQRCGTDLMLDEENFCYTAQNTGKHNYHTTTMTNAWTTGMMQTNSGNIITLNTGSQFSTYAYFPLIGTHTLSFDIEASFSSQPATNTVIDFGGFIPASTNPFAPSDGAYFRLTSAGLQGVVCYNGVETTTAVFPTSSTNSNPWVYVNNQKYQFILYLTPRVVQFWINTNGSVNLYATLNTPIGNGQPIASASVPFSVRHAILAGAASGVINFQLSRYSVRLGGAIIATTPDTMGNRLYGGYQGLSGGTMGSITHNGVITTGNEANLTAAVPTTTSAALGSGLGGSFWETATIAVNTDGIIMSYQVPAGTVLVPGRKLVLRGIFLNSYIQTVIVGGPYTAEWFLAFGHTAVSLATGEAAATKAPRRLPLPFIQNITAAQAVNTAVQQNVAFVDLGDAPIFVNPGEFIQLCTRHIGTVGTSGTVVHKITPVFGWE